MIRRILITLGAIVIALMLLLIIEPRISFSLSPWKSQEIIYRHRMNKHQRIEFQMQDVGAFGYNKRIVEVRSFFFIDFTEDIDTTQIDKSDWQRVDEYINELGLKGG